VWQRGVPLQFRLIVLNLMSNAIESVGVAGRISLVVEMTDAVTMIRVADNGPGIAPEVIDRVFDLHFTTKRGGTGLGLALVRREAERLGGSVAVAASSPHGTVMQVSLPRMSRTSSSGELEAHGAASVSDH
jgi:signal transduction histidine kinase